MPWIDDLNLAQHNDLGQVALVYFQNTNPVVMYDDTTGYKFMTHANICLAWVDESHAQKLLDMKGGCCGGKRPVIRVASETDVSRWNQALG